VVFIRNGVWLASGGHGIAGGESRISKAVQDGASSAALRRKTPEAKDLLLAELEAVVAAGEHTKSA
jgi:hypothetical protein